MLATLRRPRWIALSLLVVVLSITMIELGLWQLRRSHERAAANHLVEMNSTSTPVSPAELLTPGEPLSQSTEWRVVTVTGEYDAAGEVLVRNQSFDSVNGFDVLTPLRPATGSALFIDRGWVPSGETALDVPPVPPPPSGTVTVLARLRMSDPPAAQDLAGLPSGQSRSFAVASIASRLGYGAYDAYAEALPGQPGTGTGSDSPRARTLPELSAGPHLAYAVQWFLFTLIAIGGWAVLLRNESLAPVGSRGSDASRRVTAVRS